MRKPLWIVPVLVLIAVIGAPRAHADTLFTYTYTCCNSNYSPYDLSLTTMPVPAITAETFLPASDFTSVALTGSYWSGTTFVDLHLDPAGYPISTLIVDVNPSTQSKSLDVAVSSITDFSTPGTYIDTVSGSTLTVTAIQTPEPSTISLMLIGLGSLGLMTVVRKRTAHGLPHAT